MLRVITPLLLTLVSTACFSQEIILLVAKNGYYTIQTDAAGTPSIRKVDRVITLDGPLNPPPPTTPGTDFEKEITRITKETLDAGGSKQTGARISTVYATVATAVLDGSIKPTDALEAIKQGTSLLALAGQPDAAKWTVWRTSVGNTLTALAQEGKLQTKEQYAGVFKEIERGINAATGFPGARVAEQKGEGILDGFDLAKIIELIKLLLELFKIFKPS